MPVRVQTADFDAGREIAALRAGDPRVGAVASFIGTVRDVNDAAPVAAMKRPAKVEGLSSFSARRIIAVVRACAASRCA